MRTAIASTAGLLIVAGLSVVSAQPMLRCSVPQQAGAVAELAAAGKPSVLVPFPFAADDHQKHNALAMQRAGAARMVLDADFTGDALYRAAADFVSRPADLERMGSAARSMGKQGAARRAADLLEEFAGKR